MTKLTTRFVALALTLVMMLGALPVIASASQGEVIYENGKFGYNGYYNVISRKDYVLVPGAAIEYEMVLNNNAGNRRQVLHVIEVDPSNPDVSIVPGYYQIDQLAADPKNESNWSHQELTEMAKYYEDRLGYNIVGGMNTDLYYDTYAPRILVYNGKSIGVKGETSPSSSILYVFKDAEGNITCDVKAYNKTDFDKYLADGILLHAVSVSFAMTVKDGQLVSKTEERTSSAAARSMVGVKEDGTLVICMNDGRGANNSVGFGNFELGESMLALGCKWAANCDGGGSSTFLSKRVGEENFEMRSVPCDGAQRPTAHGIFVASNVAPTGILDVVNVESDYEIFAPGTVYTFGAEAIDTHGYAMNMPADATWALSDPSFGVIKNGKFTSNGTAGVVDIQVISGGKVVGSKTVTMADPSTFTLSATSTVIPYSTADKIRTINLPIVAMTGEEKVYVDENVISVSLSNDAAGTLNGFSFTATSDTSIEGVTATITYGTIALTYAIEFGKGSEVIYDFENGDKAGFMGFEEAKQWSLDNGVKNSLVIGPDDKFLGASSAGPLAGQFNEYLSSETFISSVTNGGQVRNGNYALAWRLDNSDADFVNWSYNVLFNVGETIVLRDVANGLKATTLGMWLYVPENAFPAAGKGLAFQSQFYVKNADGSYTCKQDHFMFTSAATGKQTNLNSATNADIPESRWVYATIDISKYDYLCTPVATDETGSRSPSFIRTYVKPDTADIVTFYIDDITLDYSSAVDDRVLPTITNPTYSTTDTAFALDNGVVVAGNSVAFSATVSDNAALDLTSGKITVDGVAVEAYINGSTLYTKSDVALGAGTHTVAFEVKDELGNPAKITRTFTVAGIPVVGLGGHNDSYLPAKAQSVYYVDINVADISTVNTLVAVIKLNNANVWETKGAIAAKGFSVTFKYNEISELLTVTVVRDGVSGKEYNNVLVSIPVRVWTFDRYNYVTNTSYAPSDLNNKPVVNIEAEIVYGMLNNKDPFSGSINVATELMTITSPYHVHDAELQVINKSATSAESGYVNRTYCKTCKSVVDWGTVINKIAHEYQLYYGEFVCLGGGCGCALVYKPGTGIFEMNGDYYYAVNDELKTGWQDSGDGKYCYAASDYKLVIGNKTINGVVYTFDENGVTDGAWVVNATGTRYSYGPGYYRREWAEIEGKHYYFGRDSYMYTGIRYIKNNPDTAPVWYDFGEDGGKTTQADPYDYVGLFEYNDELYYIGENGVGVMGLVEVDGDYYYFQFGEGFEHVYYAAMNKSVYVKTTNGVTFPDGTPVPSQTFYFDAEGKMVIKAGIVDGVYYENGKAVAYKGLVYQDDAYYYVSDGGKIVKGKTAYVNKTNGLNFPDGNPVLNRNYSFDAEGKLIILNGVVDGVYYENSRPIAYKGLVCLNGEYYYVIDGGKVMANRSYYVNNTNGLTFPDGSPVLNKAYIFDAEGRMQVYNGVVDGVYYQNGQPVAYKGLVYQDGAYYYVSDGGKTVKGKSAYVKTTNGLAFPNGAPVLNRTYTFDEEGKMLILNGVVDGVYYENSIAVPYKGLVLCDGEYYYVTDGGKVMANRSYYVKNTNGLTFADGNPVLNRNYIFDAEGKMQVYNGIVDEVYYQNGQPVAYKGLVYQDGAYYYVGEKGQIVKDKNHYVKTTNGLTFPDGTAVSSKTFYFDAEGKMVY